MPQFTVCIRKQNICRVSVLPPLARSSQRLRRCCCSVLTCKFSRRTLSDLFCLYKSVYNCISAIFRAAAFWVLFFGLVSAFLNWAVSLCSGGTLFRYAGFHPTPHKGLGCFSSIHPYDPIPKINEVTVGFADLVNFFLHFLFICAIIST